VTQSKNRVSSLKNIKARSEPLTWDDLRVAASVLRHGSLTAASRALGLSVPTIGRRIDRLERSLGVAVVHRHSRGVTPSPHAQILLAHADALTDTFDDVVRTAKAATRMAEGTVTVTTIETVITHIIAPRLADLRARHPGVRVVLRATNAIEPLDRRRADIAVRMVRPTEARVVARKLGEQRMALYASRAYLERKGRPPRPSRSLAGHDVVTFDSEMVPEARWLTERLGGEQPAVRVSSVASLCAVVESGAAIGILPTLFEPQLPELLRLAGPEGIKSREVWLALHEDLKDAPHVRAVADLIIEAAQKALGP
jgi:DNA-binding transcriptional LysR family regulator